MANDTMVTIQGWVGSVPALREVAGTPVLNFRVGATPRHFNRSNGEWVDGHTQWYAVSAWRRLAEHGERSLRQGDAVIVHGRLQHRTYVNKAGVETISIEIEAITVGHDLTRGTASFSKAVATTEQQGTAPAA
ncbi:single-stranded DNA-binding protein [Nocardioides caeni]|nr:single-stranded DNA-binding protein [Nocardioides caeni]